MSVVFSFNIKDFTARKRPRPDAGIDNGFFLKGDNGSTVILIHGLTGTPVEMRFIANSLNKKGYSISCPRLKGHGEPVRVLKMARWQDFYGSVREAFLKIEKGPVFAAGLSMGALLALLLADEFKGRIEGASCLAPTLFYDGWNTPMSKYLLPFAATPLRYLYYFKEEPPYGIKNEAIQSRIHRYYSGARLEDTDSAAQYGYPYFPVALLYQLQLLVKHLSRKLAGMRFPVQLIQAKDDDMTSVKNSKFIYDKIASDEKEMILLHDSYHIVTADQERDVVAEKMGNFFDKLRLRSLG